MTGYRGKRWDVELPNGDFEDVGGEVVAFHESGALMFFDSAQRLLLAYAHRRWVSVTPQEGAES